MRRSFADLEPIELERVVLNGRRLDRRIEAGRLELADLEDENTLIVEGSFGYVDAGAGLHRVDAPAGGTYVYSKTYPDGAPRMYCCFNQRELRAPVTVFIKAPSAWSCLANGKLAEVGEGPWTFEPTPPILPHLTNICAGDYSSTGVEAAALPVSIAATQETAAGIPGVAGSGLIEEALRFHEQTLDTPYPYGKCDFVFVPDYPGLAYGAPGLVTASDRVLSEHVLDGEPDLFAATVVVHELAHGWIGDLVDVADEEASIVEALTTYLTRTALEAICPGATPWDPATSSTLPDDAYAAGAAKIRQLEGLIGRESLLRGLRKTLQLHANSSASKADLLRYWSEAGSRNLDEWASRPVGD